MKKSTFFSRFFRETKTSFAAISVLIAGSMLQTIHAQTTYTAITGAITPITNINDAAAWPSGTALPVTGDANIWSTGKFRLLISSGNATFNGGTLVIDKGGVIATPENGKSLTLNNITFNGGIFQSSSTIDYIVDLQNKTLELNSGSIKTTSNNVLFKNLMFQNCKLAGSGTITIAQIQFGEFENYVEFLSTVTTNGFKGKFVVAPGLKDAAAGGTLKLNAITPANASFGVDVLAASAEIVSNGTPYKSSKNGKLYFTAVAPATVALTSLNLGGTSLAPGTYGLIAGKGITVFTESQKAYLDSRSTGTITVIGAKK